MTLIKGIYAASMSVLKDDLTLNINKTIEHAEMVIDNGCHGVAIFGSTGQAQLIPVYEKINLLKYDFIILTFHLVLVVFLSLITLFFFFPFHLNYYIHWV